MCIRDRFSRTQVCITSISLHLEKILLVVFFQVLWEENYSKQSCKQSYHTFIMLYVHSSFLSWLLRSRNSCSGSHIRPLFPLPTTCYGRGNSPQVDILFCFFNYKSLNGVLLANMRGIHRQPAHRSKGNHRCSQRGTMTRTEWPQLFR